MPINPDDQSTWTLEQLLERGSTAELEELLANTGPDGGGIVEGSDEYNAIVFAAITDPAGTIASLDPEAEPPADDAPPIDSEAEAAIRAELERRRAVDPARRDVATAKTALEIVQAMHAMTEATPWQPGDVELDDELELVAGAVHLLARRAVERRRELEENPLRHVGSAAAELAEIRRRFGINVAALLTEGTES